jgi:hypothetical protein
MFPSRAGNLAWKGSEMAVKNILDLLKVDTERGHTQSLGFFSLGGGSELTISSGEITPNQSFHRIDTEGDAATDTLVTINGGNTGDILILKPSSSGRDITIQDGSGNINCGSDRTFSNLNGIAVFIKFSSDWLLVSFEASN